MELTNDPFGEENLLLTQKKQRIKSKNSDRKCNISIKKERMRQQKQNIVTDANNKKIHFNWGYGVGKESLTTRE